MKLTMYLSEYMQREKWKKKFAWEKSEGLLGRIEEFVKSYVSLTDAQAHTVALWVFHTWLVDLVDCTPYIHVMSSQPRCGKTRLLEVVELLVRDPIRTSNISEAALVRELAGSTHTLLLDEVDTVFQNGSGHELLRAILNSSYRRGSPVYRVQGKGVESFEVFSPKIIAGIGKLPDTVEDRSIQIELSRSTPTKRFRYREAVQESGQLRRYLAANTGRESVQESIRTVRPTLPGFLNDRQADSWEPLLAIAEVIGCEEQTRQACRELTR